HPQACILEKTTVRNLLWNQTSRFSFIPAEICVGFRPQNHKNDESCRQAARVVGSLLKSVNRKAMLLITFALAAAGVYAGRVGDDPNMDRFEGPSYMVADPTQERSVLVTIFLQCVGLWALSWAIASIVFFLLLRHPSDWTRSLAASKSGNPSQKQKRSRASPKKDRQQTGRQRTEISSANPVSNREKIH
ncbi:hypothetical protein BVRB_038850, partial [Beta vulgaris subsp. vulgaris]